MTVTKLRYMESSGISRKVTPRMMEYLGWVIDTPVKKIDGKASDEVIGQKMRITRSRVGQFRTVFAKKFTKEEVLELCEEIMKEAA